MDNVLLTLIDKKIKIYENELDVIQQEFNQHLISKELLHKKQIRVRNNKIVLHEILDEYYKEIQNK